MRGSLIQLTTRMRDDRWSWNFRLINSVRGVGCDMMQGKGVYQFVDKYGANVDGYR